MLRSLLRTRESVGIDTPDFAASSKTVNLRFLRMVSICLPKSIPTTSFAALDNMFASKNMSTRMFDNMGESLSSQYVTHSGVKNAREEFAQYVRDQMKKGERDWSTHEVARRAKAAGFKISNTTVANILNCRVKDVSEDKLRALAKVFGVPEAEIFAAYHGTTTTDEQVIRDQRLAALAADATKLSPENRPKFEALIEYVQHTVRQMLKEQEWESPHKSRRVPKVIHGDGTIEQAEKKRA